MYQLSSRHISLWEQSNRSLFVLTLKKFPKFVARLCELNMNKCSLVVRAVNYLTSVLGIVMVPGMLESSDAR